MTAPENEPEGPIRREAALTARDAITHQYATSTKKETKTPSTKKFPNLSQDNTAQAKRRISIVISDAEDKPPRKRIGSTLSTNTTINNCLQPNPGAEPVSQADFNTLRSLVARLLHESHADRAANQELKDEIATLKQFVVTVSTLLETYDRVIDKTQIKALEAQLLSERNESAS
ncbi:uncharacterized protein N7477_000899 [Penicillium maclennaniae]|uniref:uncharacterized protein n=1 Tax=Penicillium maclennaniae TaxID=1343394 RepID=UPI002540A23B|nr:uncharacterized protein N7477_000899 [Penicillium maclennaniae]KAJ5684554.1 hypothetical protein N7477_000899 [Penicillium maclennaniae]